MWTPWNQCFVDCILRYRVLDKSSLKKRKTVFCIHSPLYAGRLQPSPQQPIFSLVGLKGMAVITVLFPRWDLANWGWGGKEQMETKLSTLLPIKLVLKNVAYNREQKGFLIWIPELDWVCKPKVRSQTPTTDWTDPLWAWKTEFPIMTGREVGDLVIPPPFWSLGATD